MTCSESELNTSVRFVFVNSSGYDAPIGALMEWEEHGSCLNIFRMTNGGQIQDTLTNYEAKHSLPNGFDAGIGLVLAWQERGSCLNIFRMTNHGRISETFTNYDESQSDLRNLHELRGKILVAHVSETRRKKTCCASELNTSVRFVFANPSGIDVGIGVVMAWEERGSSLNIFWTTNYG
ncbi:uncharacterized protein G2W53_026472 [Senna tora]|uniref:Uncharacterized protein n=1 Tax=Senna tora TaxID=362788 RepID=A0A834WFP6_9FABA|nr:uncharacterized protein G2W53_026472 [Senna tora]